jgi:hypothetical protein
MSKSELVQRGFHSTLPRALYLLQPSLRHFAPHCGITLAILADKAAMRAGADSRIVAHAPVNQVVT